MTRRPSRPVVEKLLAPVELMQVMVPSCLVRIALDAFALFLPVFALFWNIARAAETPVFAAPVSAASFWSIILLKLQDPPFSTNSIGFMSCPAQTSCSSPTNKRHTRGRCLVRMVWSAGTPEPSKVATVTLESCPTKASLLPLHDKWAGESE